MKQSIDPNSFKEDILFAVEMARDDPCGLHFPPEDCNLSNEFVVRHPYDVSISYTIPIFRE